MDTIVRRYWWLPGTKSRNTAESTGMLPPTPNPTTANKEARVTKFGDPPAARPNTPAMNSVKLNGHLVDGIQSRSRP